MLNLDELKALREVLGDVVLASDSFVNMASRLGWRGASSVWREEGPRWFSPVCGICHCLAYHPATRAFPTEERNFLGRVVWRNWPGFSGDSSYPVPALEGSRYSNPMEEFHEATAAEMWSPESEYARMRYDLLAWTQAYVDLEIKRLSLPD